MNILEIKNLTKTYKNNKHVLQDANITVEKGKIVGLLGPNGSGKTTLIKSIVGLLRPGEGEIKIDGHPPGIYSKSIISYLPDLDYLPKWMRVKDAMEFFKDFYEDFDEEKSTGILSPAGFMPLFSGIATKQHAECCYAKVKDKKYFWIRMYNFSK